VGFSAVCPDEIDDGFVVVAAVGDESPGCWKSLDEGGDGSPSHSQRIARRKAYAIMSTEPAFRVDTSGELVGKLITVDPVGLRKVQA
jgi:hypothetical protein